MLNDTKLPRFKFRLIHLFQFLVFVALIAGLITGFRSSADFTFIVERYPASDIELKEWLLDNYPCEEISVTRGEEAINGGKNKLLHVSLEGSRENLLSKGVQIPWKEFEYESGLPTTSIYKTGIWTAGFWPVLAAVGILFAITFFSSRNSTKRLTN